PDYRLLPLAQIRKYETRISRRHMLWQANGWTKLHQMLPTPFFSLFAPAVTDISVYAIYCLICRGVLDHLALRIHECHAVHKVGERALPRGCKNQNATYTVVKVSRF